MGRSGGLRAKMRLWRSFRTDKMERVLRLRHITELGQACTKKPLGRAVVDVIFAIHHFFLFFKVVYMASTCIASIYRSNVFIRLEQGLE